MSRESKAHARRRLTPRQVEILRMIRDYQKNHGCSPTMQELADVLDISKVTVFEHVEGLVEKGLLRRLPHRARSLELTARVELPDEDGHSIPIVGHIAAGNPIIGGDERDQLDLDSLFESRYGTFVLKVRGDSMIDEQICDGDYVICEQRTQPQSGETVVALLEDGEATLKKYYREKTRIRLQPANPQYKPIYAKDVQIQGVVLGVLRSYRQ
jgi:repressor LexA